MAHKDGKRDVWLNIEVLAKIHSITIEYDRNGTEIKSANDLRTKFMRGQFYSSEMNNYPGEQFSATGEEINASQLSSESSDFYKVKYYFEDSFRDVQALYIKDDLRDFFSISVFFTDYDQKTVVYPKMSQPVTNYVDVWDSYCKTSTNYGTASLAYMVSSKEKTTTHRVQTGEERPKDYSQGIRSSQDTFYGLFDPKATTPIFLSIYFGTRIRVCSFICQFPETILSINGKEKKFNRAPAGLKLWMDGELASIVKEESDSEFVDMMHWYRGIYITPKASSFRLVWDLTKIRRSRRTKTIRPVGLRRVTIGYAHEDVGDLSLKVWRSTKQPMRQRGLRRIKNSKWFDRRGYAREWKIYAIENPNVDMSHFTTKPARSAPTFNAEAANDQLHPLYHPFKLFSPVRAATKSYDFSLSQYPDLLEKPENYYPYIPISLLFDYNDAFNAVSGVTLLAFIINFPRFGTEERNKDTKYYQKNRSSVYELIALENNFTKQRTIATYESWQIPLEKLDLLDYRKSQSVENISKLMLIFTIQDPHDFDESSINAIDIYYTKGRTYQKNWESTYRLTDTTPFYPYHFGPETDFYLSIGNNTRNTSRTPGHYRQMITEGLPNYFYAHPSEIQEIKIDCSDTIVMTSFVFETVRRYQIDSYNDVTLEAKVRGAKWEVFCRTPDAEKKFGNEPFTPGDFLEMFDHKINKIMRYISSHAFRLMFSSKLTHLAIGKISIGYHDIHYEILSRKWSPGEESVATMTVKDGDNSAQSLSMLMSSTIVSPWQSDTLDPQITIDFDEVVTILDVVLKPHNIKESLKNISLIIVQRNGKEEEVASTSFSFDAGSEANALHFFNHNSNPMQIDNNNAYVPGLRRSKKVKGKKIYIKWLKTRATPVKLATLEVIFQKKDKLKKAERTCLTAHNLLRFKHGVAYENRYTLGIDEIRRSARAHAKWLLDNGKFQHSSQSKYGENLCRIKWNTTFERSKEDELAIVTFAVEEWYKEWCNYSKKTHSWNGNIFHDEQIGHFLQIIWDGKKGDNRIGVGIRSNKEYTIVVVQYENKRLPSEKNVEKIHNLNRNNFHLLTIQEEEDLRNFIKNRYDKYYQEYQKMKKGEDNDANEIRIKLERNCYFYLKTARKKMNILRKEAWDPFFALHNLDGRTWKWKRMLDQLRAWILDGFRTMSRLGKGRDHFYTHILFKQTLRIVIPNSLAQERFENLQLEAFFMGTLDLLNLSSTVGGATPSNSRLANHTLANCLSSTVITPDTALATNPTTMTINQYKKIVKVFIGYFSVLNTGSNTSRTYTTKQFSNWKECCKRIIARWDINGAKNVCIGYNALRMNGDPMDVSWPGTSDCVADQDYSSQTIKAIFA